MHTRSGLLIYGRQRNYADEGVTSDTPAPPPVGFDLQRSIRGLGAEHIWAAIMSVIEVERESIAPSWEVDCIEIIKTKHNIATIGTVLQLIYDVLVFQAATLSDKAKFDHSLFNVVIAYA